MDLPTSRTGLVTHRLMRAVGDADDAGRLPDAAVVDGAKCSFKGSVTRLRVDDPPTTVSLASVECAYDTGGYLYMPGSVEVGPDGMVAEADRGVYLVASDEGVEPGWTWAGTGHASESYGLS